ncbi:MAG: response regulator [Planctomycetota bacterium]|nr:response regulator [Planctomycetota bacterium]
MRIDSTAPERGLAVLLVDDDADHRTIARHHLRKLGERVREVTEAASMEETRRALAEADPDVVLLDLTLPDSPMDATIQAIEELARHGVPIVATSSLDEQDVREAVLAKGAAAFLGKARMVAEHLATVFDEVNGDGGGAGRAPLNAPAAGAEALRVASKLAHDANSWIANAKFRLATMRPAAQDDEQFTAHLDSIESSLRAVASIAAGARGLVADDAAAVECEPVTLDAALLDGWRAPAGCGEVEIHVEAIPPVSADRPALTAVLSILADNVSLHGEGGPLRLELRSGAGAGEELVEVLAEDSGGPWEVDGERDLTELGTRGTRRTPTAGVGLHRARRLMQRMGGELEVLAVENGARVIRLTFRRA